MAPVRARLRLAAANTIDVIDMKPPKYSLPEIERRWLVPDTGLAQLASRPYRIIEDVYVAGTLLRLRVVREPDGETIYKLCKKYGRRDALANPITNIYLTEEEHLVLSALPGACVRKRRHAMPEGAIDVYPAPLSLAIFEMEFDSEQAAANYIPPSFAGAEITDDDIAYAGDALALRFAQARN